MKNTAESTLAHVWSQIEVGMGFRTPDDAKGANFSVIEVTDSYVAVLTEKGETVVTISRESFVEAMSYLLQHGHNSAKPCEIRSNNSRELAGPLCVATRNFSGDVRVINYIAPILAGFGLFGLGGGRPNTVWVI